MAKKMAQLMNAPTPSFLFLSSGLKWLNCGKDGLCCSYPKSGLQVAFMWPSTPWCAAANGRGLGLRATLTLLLGPVPALVPGETGGPAKEEGVEPGLH